MPIDVPAPRGPIFVFGEYFLRKFYTVFDRDQSLLGFTLANHDRNDNSKEDKIKTPYDNKKEEEGSFLYSDSDKKKENFIENDIGKFGNHASIQPTWVKAETKETSMIDEELLKNIGSSKDFIFKSNSNSNEPSDPIDLDFDFLITPDKLSNEKDNMDIVENSNIDILNKLY